LRIFSLWSHKRRHFHKSEWMAWRSETKRRLISSYLIECISGTNISLILVGNQLDCEEEREVSKERAMEYKSGEKLDGFVETSAKSGVGVKDLFVRTAKMLYLQEKENQLEDGSDDDDDPTITIDSNIGSKKKKKGCKC